MRLPANRKHWKAVHAGLAIGYRRGTQTSTWFARVLKSDGRYSEKRLAIADDFDESNGQTVLTFSEAQRRAQGFEDALQHSAGGKLEHVDPVVNDLLDDYLAHHKTQSNSWRETKYIIDGQIRPPFGRKRVSELTRPMVQRWLTRQAEIDTEDPEAQRKRRSTANRRLTVLKAALNFAYQGPSSVKDAWREVKPFRGVDAPKVRFLKPEECLRLCNAADPDLRDLIIAALLTGCRYSELGRLVASDYDRDSRTLAINTSKSGKRRFVPLTDEGIDLFDRLATGKLGDDLMLTRSDGGRWQKSHQCRPMREACKVAKIQPAATFHILRHTYASLLARENVSLQVIGAALGHADTRMTERHYAHLQPGHIAEQINKHLPKFGLDPAVSNVEPIRG